MPPPDDDKAPDIAPEARGSKGDAAREAKVHGCHGRSASEEERLRPRRFRKRSATGFRRVILLAHSVHEHTLLIWGFPKLGVPLGVLSIRGPTIWGSVLGGPYFRKTPPYAIRAAGELVPGSKMPIKRAQEWYTYGKEVFVAKCAGHRAQIRTPDSSPQCVQTTAALKNPLRCHPGGMNTIRISRGSSVACAACPKVKDHQQVKSM